MMLFTYFHPLKEDVKIGRASDDCMAYVCFRDCSFEGL